MQLTNVHVKVEKHDRKKPVRVSTGRKMCLATAGAFLVLSGCSVMSVDKTTGENKGEGVGIAAQNTNTSPFMQAKNLIEQYELPQSELKRLTSSLDENVNAAYIELQPGVVLRIEPVRGAPPKVAAQIKRKVATNIGNTLRQSELKSVRQLFSLEGFASAATGVRQTTLLVNWTLKDERNQKEVTSFFERQSLVGSVMQDPWKLASDDIVKAFAQRTADRVLRTELPAISTQSVTAQTPPPLQQSNADTPVSPSPSFLADATTIPVEKQEASRAGKSVDISKQKTTSAEIQALKNSNAPTVKGKEEEKQIQEKKSGFMGMMSSLLPGKKEDTTTTVPAPDIVQNSDITVNNTTNLALPSPKQQLTNAVTTLNKTNAAISKESSVNSDANKFVRSPREKASVESTQVASQEKKTTATATAPSTPPFTQNSPSVIKKDTDKVETSAQKTVNKKTKPFVRMGQITGAPGTGNSELLQAMSRILEQRHNKTTLKSNKESVLITANVDKKSLAQTDVIKIIWKVEKDAISIGQIVQENEIPKGMLDKSWGENAEFAARNAYDGILELLRQL